MQSKKSYKIGKVVKFDGNLGEIFTPTEEYYFTKNDLLEGIPVENDDLVMFNGKTESVFPQAYFVKKLSIKNTEYTGKE